MFNEKRRHDLHTYRIEVFLFKTRTLEDYGGGYTQDDLDGIVTGYKVDPEFCSGKRICYTRKNGTKAYFVTEE